ncbi:MAG TPA: cytochrome b/b6 domain-containing protein [Mycobacterium sp.]|nr:cytochrome b/b6 domain-containing protein [Mycobacterium sp.]
MHWRNGAHGYGLVTKTLHWLTVAAVVTQFAVGLAMEAEDPALELEKDRVEQFEKLIEGQGEAAEELFEREIDALEEELDAREENYVAAAFAEPGLSLPEIHVLLGLSIIVLALIRILWRTVTPLPPWAGHLTPGERRLQAGLENALLTLLLVVPLTGLLLLAAGIDWLPLHVGAQLVLLAVIAVHVGLVLKHTVVHRHRHLARMV